MPIEKLPIFCLENVVFDQLRNASDMAIYAYIMRHDELTIKSIRDALGPTLDHYDIEATLNFLESLKVIKRS